MTKKQLEKAFSNSRRNVIASIKHVSSSGMHRVITFYIITKNGIECIDNDICDALDYKRDKKYWGIRVGGCGMDMIYNVLDSFTRKMDIKWDNGYFNL